VKIAEVYRQEILADIIVYIKSMDSVINIILAVNKEITLLMII